MTQTPRRHSRLRRWLKLLAIAFAAMLILLLAWGVLVEPRLILQHETVDAHVRQLPPEWNGRTVAVISDLHVGMWLANLHMVRRAVSDVVREKPNAALIAGDFLFKADGDEAQLQLAADIVRPLVAAGIPTYAVLGNHDYSVNWRSDPVNDALAAKLAAKLQSAGVVVLRNEAVALGPDGRTQHANSSSQMYLVGLDSEWARHTNAEAAFANVPETAARIVVMHNPWSFRDVTSGRAPFAVAAHTHGGQIRIPFTPNWSWIDLVEHRRIPAGGWAWDGFGQRGNALYVQRGLGFSTAPIRINDPPSITTFVLHPQN